MFFYSGIFNADEHDHEQFDKKMNFWIQLFMVQAVAFTSYIASVQTREIFEELPTEIGHILQRIFLCMRR